MSHKPAFAAELATESQENSFLGDGIDYNSFGVYDNHLHIIVVVDNQQNTKQDKCSF